MLPTLRRPRTLVPWLGLAALLVAARAEAQPWRASVLALPQVAAAAPESSASPPPASLRPASAVLPPLARQPSIAGPIAGGIVGGTVGAYLGAIVGVASEPQVSDDISGSGILGFLLGEGLLLPVGVHAGNGGHGRILDDLAASLAGEIVALGMGAVSNNGAGFVAGAATQLGFTVWTERHVGARRLRKAQAEAAQRALRGGIMAPAPPAEPEPLVPPPPPTK